MTLPVLLVADSEAEFNNTIAIWEALAEKPLVPGQPDYLLASILAYQKYLLIQRCNAAFINMLLDFAAAPNLDYIVALLGVVRTSAQPATCSLKFILVSGHGSVTIPAGTRVSSSDGKAVFAVDEDALVLSGTDDATTFATCQTDGIIGNDYAIGTVNTIMDVQPWLSTCENVDITASGVDTETDEELRQRAKLAPSSFSVAGPRDAYIYFTKSVSPLICDVAVISSTEDISVPPGEVDIYPLLDNGNVPNSSMIALIQSTLSADKIRPLTDTVVVSAPTQVDFEISLNVTKLSSYPESADFIIDAINLILIDYRVAKLAKLGQDIVATEIEKLCKIDGVYDLDLTITPPAGRDLTGRNLVFNPSEFGYLSMFYVAVTGENNG